MAAADNEKMSDEEIYAQMSYVAVSRCGALYELRPTYCSHRTFILAGMDTTSNALSRILQLLAQHPDVQEKLRAEIAEAQGGDGSDIPYDDLVKLPYLDAVCRETLRIHTPVHLSGPRLCAPPSPSRLAHSY